MKNWKKSVALFAAFMVMTCSPVAPVRAEEVHRFAPSGSKLDCDGDEGKKCTIMVYVVSGSFIFLDSSTNTPKKYPCMTYVDYEETHIPKGSSITRVVWKLKKTQDGDAHVYQFVKHSASDDGIQFTDTTQGDFRDGDREDKNVGQRYKWEVATAKTTHQNYAYTIRVEQLDSNFNSVGECQANDPTVVNEN